MRQKEKTPTAQNIGTAAYKGTNERRKEEEVSARWGDSNEKVAVDVVFRRFKYQLGGLGRFRIQRKLVGRKFVDRKLMGRKLEGAK